MTGAFNPFGPSAQLTQITDKATFIVSDHVINECKWNINRCSPNTLVANSAKIAVINFLKKLNAIEVIGTKKSGYACPDNDDQLIFDSAYTNSCSFICTYNFPDFPISTKIEIKTPLAILRLVRHNNINYYIQYPILSDTGTLLFWGTIHHESSMGVILRSKNYVTVFADKKGYICLDGPSVHSTNPKNPLRRGEEFALIIRYKKNNFEASRWSINKCGKWAKEILTTSKCQFGEVTSTALFFEKNNKFMGQTQNVSGMPRYVKEKKLPSILANKSIEAATGSLDLKYVLSNAKIHNTIRGFQVSFPIKKMP